MCQGITFREGPFSARFRCLPADEPLGTLKARVEGLAFVEKELNVRGETAPRHDPYRFWASGILVELGTFVAFALIVIALTALIVLLIG